MSDDYYRREREYDHYRRREIDRDIRYRRERERDRRLSGQDKDSSDGPLGRATRVAVFVAALWLTVVTLELAAGNWRTVFVIGAVVVTVGLGRELVSGLIRSTSGRGSGVSSFLVGAVAGLIVGAVLQAAGVMGVVAQFLANAPPV